MNSIFWKGVPSTTIPGLLICELPPISKPRMRTKETVIDGRDGSIVEELGYESYYKSVIIGLHGDYDINEIIKYFSGEGDLVFSNEIDKVYKARIFANIDFERLIRFKRAVVQFHVQPFKYKRDEVFKETEIATASGTSIVLNDSGSATIKSIVVGDGSKTEGQVEITAMGKNLLPFPYFHDSNSANGIRYTVKNDGSIDIKGTASAISTFALNTSLQFVDGEKYTISGRTKNTIVYFCYDKLDGKRVYEQSTFVWSKDYKLVSIFLQVEKGTTVDESIYPMLEVGATASAYVPYQKSVATYDYSTKTLNGGLQAFAPMTTITNGDGATMTVEYFKDFEVFNEGLELSRPLMVLRGRGTVEISVNGTGIFTYTFPEGENEVIIDSEKEDAYLGSVLKNRNMNGEFPILLPKTNKIGWSGDVESIEILPRSRWL